MEDLDSWILCHLIVIELNLWDFVPIIDVWGTVTFATVPLPCSLCIIEN